MGLGESDTARIMEIKTRKLHSKLRELWASEFLEGYSTDTFEGEDQLSHIELICHPGSPSMSLYECTSICGCDPENIEDNRLVLCDVRMAWVT